MYAGFVHSHENADVRPRRLLTYLALFILPLAPIVALGVIAYGIAARSAEELIENNNVSAARITRQLVEQEFDLRVNGLRAISRTPDLIQVVRAGDVAGVRSRLQAVVETHPKVVRAFVTDPEGVLWSDFPEAPESLGENFAYREWFEGLSAEWEPYVSPVYQRFAAPQILLVAVAVPVRDPATGEVLAALVYQLDLDELSDLLAGVKVGLSGYVFLLDHHENVATHPSLDLQGSLHDEYADSIAVRETADEPRSIEYTDPVSGTAMLATAIACNVQGETWTAIAQQPIEEAFGPIHTLRNQIAVAGLLFAVILAGFLAAMVRVDARVRRLSVQLAQTNASLQRENEERREAEVALAHLNADLERRVVERTRELRDMKSQLIQSQKMEAIGRLAGGVAHDFNNLLTVITGYASILLGKELDPDSREAAEEIGDAAKRAAAVTRQLLAFSRRQVMKPVNIDVNEVVRKMEGMLRRLIGEDISLVTHFEPDVYTVHADPGQIEQVIMNLAVNARDAMPNGGNLTIETDNVELDEEYVSTHAEAQLGPHVMLAVTDTGDGMTPEIQERLFDPFFTTKAVGRGTGLGLSTVYGIVKQTGGNIWVYSEVGEGTVFKVYLPAVPDSAVALPAVDCDTADSSGTETILVVEDDDAVRTLIQRVLKMKGYTVLAAAGPDDAVWICKESERIDLVLTDVVMPGMNGRQLADEIRELIPGIRVVFMSGYTDDAIVHHGVLEQGVAFIEKPISPEVLARRIRTFLS